MWQDAGEPITLLLAGGQIIDSLKQASAIPSDCLTSDGDSLQTGPVRLVRIPFVPQDEFDRLLHFSDDLIVRGEDSFVRAQLSGKPFFWHIYPQDEMAHLDKLSAFWRQIYPLFPSELATAHRALSEELNGKGRLKPHQRLQYWQTLRHGHSRWAAVAESWRNGLFRQQTATEKLANFIKHR